MSAQPEVDSQGQPAPSKAAQDRSLSDAMRLAQDPRLRACLTRPQLEPKLSLDQGPEPRRTGGTTSPKHGRTEHQATRRLLPHHAEGKATCPLCQAELNVGSKGPANYNTCTTRKLQVWVNLCGFNPDAPPGGGKSWTKQVPWALVRAEPGVMEASESERAAEG